jgi:hypothetical protein
MKCSVWRWVLLPAVVFAAGAAAGVKAGIEYAKGNYVSKDRKFVEGEVINSKHETRKSKTRKAEKS